MDHDLVYTPCQKYTKGSATQNISGEMHTEVYSAVPYESRPNKYPGPIPPVPYPESGKKCNSEMVGCMAGDEAELSPAVIVNQVDHSCKMGLMAGPEPFKSFLEQVHRCLVAHENKHSNPKQDPKGFPPEGYKYPFMEEKDEKCYCEENAVSEHLDTH